MRLLQGLLLLALSLATVAVAAPDRETSETGFSLLHAAVEAPRHVSFIGQVQLLELGAHGSEASIFRVEHLAPNLFERRYLAPENLYGDSTIFSGNAVYSIDPKRKQIVVTPHEVYGLHFGWTHNFALLTRNYRPVKEPDEIVAGRPVDVIRLVNRYSGVTTLRIWIDEKTSLMLRRDVYASNGSVVLQMHFDKVRFTNAIPRSAFALPHGYTIVKGPSEEEASDNPAAVVARAGFASRAPHYLPEGFVAVGAELGDERGVRILHVLYSDGLRTVSLFENARGAAVNTTGYHAVKLSVGGREMDAVDEGATTMLAWSDDRLHYALVGDLGRTELEKIAASI